MAESASKDLVAGNTGQSARTVLPAGHFNRVLQLEGINNEFQRRASLNALHQCMERKQVAFKLIYTVIVAKIKIFYFGGKVCH